jgi:hypothetical protein
MVIIMVPPTRCDDDDGAHGASDGIRKHGLTSFGGACQDEPVCRHNSGDDLMVFGRQVEFGEMPDHIDTLANADFINQVEDTFSTNRDCC